MPEKNARMKLFLSHQGGELLPNFEPAYRARAGDYRILFDVVGDTIEIGRVLHRKDSYKKI